MAPHKPPKFRAEELAVGSATIVSLHGELDVYHAARVTEGFSRALDRNPATLAADLRGLTFMDSTGVHALLVAEARCRRQGARFVIISGTAAIDRVLSLVGLDRMFDIVDSPDQLPGAAAPLSVAV